jgi:hypothetical protein
MKNYLIVVLVGGGAFWGGMKYAQSQPLSGRMGNFAGRNFNGQFGQGLPGGAGAGMMGGQLRNGANLATGEILSKDDKSITLKLRNGGSMVVFLSGSTNLSKSVEAAQSDLEVGKNVVVGGVTNNDGTITAQTIQLRDLPVQPVNGTQPAGNNVQPNLTNSMPGAQSNNTQPVGTPVVPVSK